MSERKKIVRYTQNPFTEEFFIQKSKKQINISNMGSNISLLDNDTGEIQGTHISTYKEVDAEEFVKIFTGNLALVFGLTSSGIKALTVLLFCVQHYAMDSDVVLINKYTLDEFVKNTDHQLSLATLYRGLEELEKNKIIAKHAIVGRYFINPNFCFNGNRIKYSTTVVKV